MSGGTSLKDEVRQFWNRQACGEVYAIGDTLQERIEAQARARYELEPYIFDFAQFREARGRDVLEIGVGMGADHAEWAKADPRALTGVDLVARNVEMTAERLALYELTSDLRVADAEALPFPDETFDIVYAWGVLHHSPDTPRAIREVYRVLRPGGVARVMIYHRMSLVGVMLWARYALARGRPFTSLDAIYHAHLESRGTKAYSVGEARALFHQFASVRTTVELSGGDLLLGAAGQRHPGATLAVMRRLFAVPGLRWLIRRTLRRFGLFLMIEARR